MPKHATAIIGAAGEHLVAARLAAEGFVQSTIDEKWSWTMFYIYDTEKEKYRERWDLIKKALR
jgi:hypothetical protein